ncbi:MAG: PP2C family protein-serine/threonine phosphatase, partial [Enterobacteriaceae bacterium]
SESNVISHFTLVYGVLDLVSGQGLLCQAGHPTPLLINPQGQVSYIGEGGAPVGLIEQAEYQDTAFTLQPGDRLYLYTDGIIECENPQNALFSTQRLQELLLISRHLPSTQLLSQIKQALVAWRDVKKNTELTAISHTSFNDDISLLMIERQQ